jgi:hypothetical protein
VDGFCSRPENKQRQFESSLQGAEDDCLMARKLLGTAWDESSAGKVLRCVLA